MSQHYTSNTVSVSAYCRQCKTSTQHRVQGHRMTYCIPCQERQEREHLQRSKPEPARQQGLFQ